MSDDRATRTLPDPPDVLLSYVDACRALDGHPLRSRDVPVEHELSLPVPSARWARPAYAVFAGAAVRRPGAPKQLAAPDRWWAVDLRSGALVAYGLAAVVPFTDWPLTGPVTVPPIDRPVRMLADDHAMLGRLMDEAVPAFLGRAGEPTAATRTDLGHLWRSLVPRGAADWYHALAPDFFAWLEDGKR